MNSLRPLVTVTSDQKSYLAAARKRIMLGTKENSDAVKRLLQVYEDAYGSLLDGRDPLAFKKFLLRAPALFLEIGEKMGALSHITSFWRYRFKDPNAMVDAEELVMVLQDLSKGFAESRPSAGQRGRETRRYPSGETLVRA